MILPVLKLLVSSHPLNFKGVIAFMFCYFIKDMLSTTLLCLLYAHKQTVAFNALLFMILRLSYSSCYNIVAKFYWIISIMPMIEYLDPSSQCFTMHDQDCVGSMSPQKLFCYHLPTRGRAGVKLGDAWYVSNVSIIFYAPCLFYTNLYMFCSCFVALLYIFRH